MKQASTGQEEKVLGSKDRLETSIAAGIGTCVENYDFIAYSTAAALYFGTDFFPAGNRFISTMLAFATLAVGFVMRPVGGAVGGYLADKYGRKPVLVGALLVMGGSTFLIGLMPTYATIGLAAPIILTLIRMVQGLAFGAEWGGAITMAYEHAPWNKRGMYCAIPQSGNPLGIALASGMFALCAFLPGDWRWRIPFLLSALLVVVGLVVRSKLSESPEFQEAQASGKTEKKPTGYLSTSGLEGYSTGDFIKNRRIICILSDRHLPPELHLGTGARYATGCAERHNHSQHRSYFCHLFCRQFD